MFGDLIVTLVLLYGILIILFFIIIIHDPAVIQSLNSIPIRTLKAALASLRVWQHDNLPNLCHCQMLNFVNNSFGDQCRGTIFSLEDQNCDGKSELYLEAIPRLMLIAYLCSSSCNIKLAKFQSCVNLLGNIIWDCKLPNSFLNILF